MAPALSDILRITSSLLILMLLTFCMGATNLEAKVLRLANDEVEALLEVATQLGKKGWNRNMTLCNETVTVLPLEPDGDNKVLCNCSFPGGVCHVVAIYLKRQDLNGSLPKAIQKLPHLKQLDLWANYLSGNIPPGWVDTKLEFLSLGVNRLNGTIPSYLGNITTLRYLNIENNMFSGTVPPELGDLVNLEILTLSANNLSGELPLTLANLIRLKELRLSSNNFTGRIPEFIQSWKQLDALEIQAGGFTGPIPLNISLLTNLTELRISNLLGSGSLIPNIDSIAGIEYLMLSNCNLSGKFPEYLTNKSQLKILPKIKLGNGDIVQAKGRGTVKVSTTKGTKVIKDVLFIPELNQNLLSVAQMLRNGYEVAFKENFCFITDANDSAIAKVKMEGSSFYLDLNVVEGNALSVKSEISVDWNKKLEHYNLESLNMLHDGDMIKGMPEIHTSDQVCKRLQICDKDGKISDGDLFSIESNNVYVKNLAESTTHEDMKDVFNEHGAITGAVMMRAADKKSKCFEVVNFEKSEDAAETVKSLNGKEIDAEESYVREWYMKTGGATSEGNPDGDLSQNRADISPVHHDLKTKTIPVASLEFLKMKLGLPKANLKEEC